MSQLSSVLRSALLFRRQRNSLPQTLILFITSRCNARCDFCLYRHRVEDPVSAADELTLTEIEKLAASYGPLHYLALSGGEPFVRDDVRQICQTFVDRCGTRVIDIPSNFWFERRMLDAVPRLAADNPDVVIDIQLALDHTGSAHDESRGVRGLYERARRTFARLAAARAELDNLRLKINVVYLDRNREELDEILSTINRDFAHDRVQLTYPHFPLKGQFPECRSDLPDPEGYFSTARRFEESGVRRGTDLHTLGVSSAKHYYRRLLSKALSGEHPVGDYCEAGRNFLVIDETGAVMPCEPLWESIGSLRDSGFDLPAILQSADYSRFRDCHLGDGRCNCTYSCAILGRVALSPVMIAGTGVRAFLRLLRGLLFSKSGKGLQ